MGVTKKFVKTLFEYHSGLVKGFKKSLEQINNDKEEFEKNNTVTPEIKKFYEDMIALYESKIKNTTNFLNILAKKWGLKVDSS
jgi:hypothetical protein